MSLLASRVAFQTIRLEARWALHRLSAHGGPKACASSRSSRRFASPQCGRRRFQALEIARDRLVSASFQEQKTRIIGLRFCTWWRLVDHEIPAMSLDSALERFHTVGQCLDVIGRIDIIHGDAAGAQTARNLVRDSGNIGVSIVGPIRALHEYSVSRSGRLENLTAASSPAVMSMRRRAHPWPDTGMFWLSRNKFVGSYVDLTFVSRSHVAPGYTDRMRAGPSSVRKPT